MELELKNHYVIGVVVFMTVLLCCKNVLEFLQLCVHLSEKCVLDSCCVCACLYYNHKELLVTSTLVMITVCSIGQPIILLVCNAIRQHLTDHGGMWTVPGWAPDPLMGWWDSACASHPGVLGSIPKRWAQG